MKGCRLGVDQGSSARMIDGKKLKPDRPQETITVTTKKQT